MKTDENIYNVKLWKDICKEDRADTEFMEKIRKAYIDCGHDKSNDKDIAFSFKKIKDALFDIRENIKKRAANEAGVKTKLTTKGIVDAKQDEKDIIIYKQLTEKVAAYDAFFITASGRVEYRDNSGDWCNSSLTAFERLVCALDTNSRHILGMVFFDSERNKNSVVYSWRNHNKKDVLNKLSKQQWMPVDADLDTPTEYSEAFELLFRALTDNRQDIIDHLEQVIVWKYRYPEEYRLPAISIYGAGGLGKNTLVDNVLCNIFSPEQVMTADFSMVKKFGDLLLGKTIIYFDEMVARAEDANFLKSIIGQKNIPNECKGLAAILIESTALTITGGNDKIGSMLLSGNDADRRWTIIKSTKSVKQYTKEAYAASNITDEEVNEMMTHNLAILNDIEECGKWFQNIYTKWKSMTNMPTAYQSEDYTVLIERQLPIFDQYMEAIFYNKSFVNINKALLFKLYGIFYTENTNNSNAGKFTGTKNTFHMDVKLWLKDKNMDIILEQRKIFKSKSNKIMVPMWNYFKYNRTQKVPAFVNNELYYDKEDRCLNPEWFDEDSNMFEMVAVNGGEYDENDENNENDLFPNI